MDYIIDQVIVSNGKQYKRKSFLIKNERVSYISDHMNRIHLMKMVGNAFILEPGKVIYEDTLLNEMNVSEYKKKMKSLIQSGSSVVLSSFSINWESELVQMLKRAKSQMLNSSIDYAIGVKLPVHKLTPSFIRQSKRLKLPFIIVEIDTEVDLERLPWGWIKEAMFPHTSPIIPQWINEDEPKLKRRLKKQKERWQGITTRHSIPSCPPFDQGLRVPKNVLKQIGIYPRKGEMLVGADLDYNLFYVGETSQLVAENDQLDYDKDNPNIVVVKGKLLKLNNEVLYKPGFGEEIIVKRPGHFSTIPGET